MSKEKVNVAPEQLRKITGKDVCTDAEGKSMLIAPKKATPLFNVYGVIKSIVPGESTFGPFLKFKGDFLAERFDGKMFRASSFIAPPPLDEVLEQQFVGSKNRETGEEIACQFSALVGIKPHNNKVGYMWYAEPLVELQPNDTLMSLRSQAQLRLTKQ